MGGLEIVAEWISVPFGWFRDSEVAAGMRWFLGCVFLLSGIVKLRRPVLAAIAMADFGLVKRPRRSLGLVGGAGEIVIGLGLASRVLAPWDMVLPLLLLSLFVYLLARAIHRKERFPCFCFGETATVISKSTVARTCVLLLLALAIATTPVPAWTDLDGLVLQLLVGVALLGTTALISRMPWLLRWNPLDLSMEVR